MTRLQDGAERVREKERERESHILTRGSESHALTERETVIY